MEQLTLMWSQPMVIPATLAVETSFMPLAIQEADDDDRFFQKLFASIKLKSVEEAEDFLVEMCRISQHTIISYSSDKEVSSIVNEAADAMDLTVHKVRTSETGELWCEPEFVDGEVEGIVLIDDADFVGASPAALAAVYEVILDPPEGVWVCMLGNRAYGDSLATQLPTSVKMKFASCELT